MTTDRYIVAKSLAVIDTYFSVKDRHRTLEK